MLPLSELLIDDISFDCAQTGRFGMLDFISAYFLLRYGSNREAKNTHTRAHAHTIMRCVHILLLFRSVLYFSFLYFSTTFWPRPFSLGGLCIVFIFLFNGLSLACGWALERQKKCA